jgi:hypothetical protein
VGTAPSAPKTFTSQPSLAVRILFPAIPRNFHVAKSQSGIPSSQIRILPDIPRRPGKTTMCVRRGGRRAQECLTRLLRVDGFWIDRDEVTNAQFKQFVDATGYVTLAERGLDPA